MEYPSSAYSQSDNPSIIDIESRNSSEEQFVNMSEMMNLDNFSAWCGSPSSTEQIFASYGFPSTYASYDQLDFSEQNNNDNESPLGFVDMQFGHQISSVPRPIGHSLSDRMLRALSLFKESSGGGILAQMWVPVRDGDNYILSTYEQPYLLDQILLGYREVSRSFTFSVEEKPGSFPGLPGRVFMSKIPEWTSNVSYYNSGEYLRAKHAEDHEVRGSVAIPIFSPTDKSCCAVLELVTVREKANFDSEMEAVCSALEAVDLKTTTPSWLIPQRLSPNQRTALSEITDVLRAVCHAHRLPLALTWIPCTLEEDGDKMIKIQPSRHDNNNFSSNLKKTRVLCIEETACYANDKEMQGFVHACSEHPLGEGQGVAGKSLQTNVPFFYADVKNYHIKEYPLVQHARKFKLNAAVSIRLRSTYTGNDDYILEFFLPVSMKGTKEQQLLLDSLSGTMQRICRSLRTVSDAELDGSVSSMDEEVIRLGQSCFPRDAFVMNSQPLDRMSLDASVVKKDCRETDWLSELQVSRSRRQSEKKRSTAEKTVSLSVLQQYFSGSLKDAAKSIGVCPTTLKRICRQHGISRWPSRKINKVNRSLKKIQIVLDSVQGVEGGLKFDPTTGELIAAGSVIQEYDPRKNVFLPTTKIQPSFFPASAVKIEKDSHENFVEQPKKSDISTENANFNSDTGSFHHWSSSYHPFESKPNPSYVNDEMELGIIENNNNLSSSSMTDSSNASGSLSSSPSPNSTENPKQFSKAKTTNSEESGSKLTVKATYGEDTIRFKFEPSVGCLHLYEEVAKRFRLILGTFQLKYLDDEEEWVLLVSDSDLQECVEIMEFVGKQSVKFLVRDVPSGNGSSGSSGCFLTPGS